MTVSRSTRHHLCVSSLSLALAISGCDGEADLEPTEPTPPAAEEALQFPAQPCASECTSDVPQPGPRGRNLVKNGRRARGTNTQVLMPQNLQLADVDGDGSSDFVQFSSNKIFVSKTDYERTGITHLYTSRPIKRVLTADFVGAKSDQICAILDNNNLECYGISPNKQDLWWWFTQGSFLADNEDAIFGDFDGDGGEDALVYPRAGGAYRMYSRKGNGFFAPMPKWSAGNINAATAGLGLRAGDWNGDGRDDLMMITVSGQIISYVSAFDGTNNTFWWAFSSNTHAAANEQVSVARLDDNYTDDVVIRNKTTGATRLLKMEWGGGYLPGAGAYTGQMSVEPNSLVFFAPMKGTLAEPGNSTRDDAMVYHLSTNQVARADARWDGSKHTFWWHYTSGAPQNHTGWAAFETRNLLAVKCNFTDLKTVPNTDAFYRDLIFKYDGLVSYWKDVTYGSWDLSGSKLVDTWNTIDLTYANWAKMSRFDRANWCLNAYPGTKEGFVSTISLVNSAQADVGAVGNRVVGSPAWDNVSFLAHETAHTFGWGHSYDDTQNRHSGGPGEYLDKWDIQSAMNVFGFGNSIGVSAGPEMNAQFKSQASLIPAHRIQKLVPAATRQTARLAVAAINRPEAGGPLMVRVGADDKNYFTIEYRMKSGWDQGIPQNTVLVHRVTSGQPYLITGGGPERLVGSTSTFSLPGSSFLVSVNSFATAGYTADVTVSY